MQTNFQNRQASLIAEAIETIKAKVKANGRASKHDYNQPVIPAIGSKIYDITGTLIIEIGAEKSVNKDGILIGTEYQEPEDLMQLADYCLNYKPQS